MYKLMKYWFFTLISTFSFFVSAQTVEKTLAVVEEEMVSLLDLKETKQRAKKGFLDDSPLMVLFKKSDLYKKDSTLLDFLIYQKILDISIAQSKLEVSPNHLKKELNNKRKKAGLSKKAFSKALVKSQFTADSYKEFLKKTILRHLLLQKEIMEKIRISDEDVNEYALQKQETALFSSFKYELAFLYFPLTSEGKIQAQKVSQQLEQNPAFFDKWKPEKEEKKEALKNISLSSLHPSIKKHISALSTGQISPILSLPSGYHIFKVIWKAPIITNENKKRKNELSAILFKEIFRKKLKLWLEAKKEKSFIQTQI